MCGICTAIKITAAYSNAVLTVLLPRVAQFAHDIQATAPEPLTMEAVSCFDPDTVPGDVGGCLVLKNGDIFWFNHGRVANFRTPNSIINIQHSDDISLFLGQVNITRDQAIQCARNTLQHVGYNEESLYADLEPEVELPPRIGTNIVPRYRIKWVAPNSGLISAELEVNASNKRTEALFLLNLNTWRPPPSLPIQPEIENVGRGPPEAGPQAAAAWLSNNLPKLDICARRLGLPMNTPTTPNDVAGFISSAPGNMTGPRIRLKNGFLFFVGKDGVRGFEAPDAFFTSDHEIKVRDFLGKWHLTEQEAASLVLAAVRKLGYEPTQLGMDSAPEVRKPDKCVNDQVPRYFLQWWAPTNSTYASAEVDAQGSSIKRLFLQLRWER